MWRQIFYIDLFCFFEQKRPEILKVNPKAKVTEVVKEIARCWSMMTKEDRTVYKIEAKRGKNYSKSRLSMAKSQLTKIERFLLSFS